MAELCAIPWGGAAALVPERFKELHISRLPDGEVSPAFAARFADLVRGGNP